MQNSLSQPPLNDNNAFVPSNSPSVSGDSRDSTIYNPSISSENNNTPSHLKSTVLHRLHFYRYHLIDVGISTMLTFQGVKGLAQSVRFILYDYSIIESQLAQRAISQEQVYQLVAHASLIMISTLISFFFALKISVLKSKSFHYINQFIGLLMILFNAVLINYLFSYVSKIDIQKLIISLIGA